MFVKVRRKRAGRRRYEYVDIVKSHRVGGKVGRLTLGTLGRRDQLSKEAIGRLVAGLQKLAVGLEAPRPPR